MKKIDTYILEKFKIHKGIKLKDNFYILVPVGSICHYCYENYSDNWQDGFLTCGPHFDWQHVFVLRWEDIENIFRHYKHNLSNDFNLNDFQIYDIKNVDSYSSIEDFLDNVKKRNVSPKNFIYNEKYTKELNETIK